MLPVSFALKMWVLRDRHAWLPLSAAPGRMGEPAGECAGSGAVRDGGHATQEATRSTTSHRTSAQARSLSPPPALCKEKRSSCGLTRRRRNRPTQECKCSSRPLVTHLDSVPQVLPEHKRLLCNLLFFLTVFLLTSIARLIFLGLFLLVRNTNKTTTEKK